jgi:hypothetical protein
MVFLLSLPLLVHAQELWPGDVNNNGIVNGVDVLYIGLAFNATGPGRSDENDEWNPVTIEQLWNLSFPDGINFAYADCNGDGVVDENDISVVEDNIGLTHGNITGDGYANGLPGIDPPLSLVPSTDRAEPGNQVNLNLGLGTEELPVHDFYGLTFQFSFTSDLIDQDDDDESEVEYEDDAISPWIARFQDDDLEALLVADAATGTGDFSITRTDQQPVAMGQGPIGLFTIVIEDIVVGLEQPRPLEFRIDRVRLIDTSLQTTAITPDTTTILIARDTSQITTSGGSSLPDQHQVDVFPNPARGSVYVKTTGAVDDIQVFDLLGRRVPVHWESGAVHRIALQHPVPGTYWLRVKQDSGIETRKITFISQ